MKNQEAERKWWDALCDRLEENHGRADLLFVYDAKQGRLDRCFDRDVVLRAVDVDTVSNLYRAAAEGRLGLLQSKDLKPQLLTTDPQRIFASAREDSVAVNRTPTTTERDGASPKQTEASEEKNTNKTTDGRKSERAADAGIFNRLYAAEALYRQAVYVPKTPKEDARGEGASAKRKAEQTAALEHAVEVIRNIVPLQMDDAFVREREQLIADLARMMLDIRAREERDAERLEKEREAREELIAAQNMFIWAAVSDMREREQFNFRMELLLEMDTWQEQSGFEEIDWQKRTGDMARELERLDLDGADEELCNEKIRDYLDGKTAPKESKEKETEEQQGEMAPVSAEMWGNTLRHFCRFAASEVPLSVRHAKVAEHCRKILKQAKEQGITLEEMGLDAQDQAVIKGTIELGTLVKRGLLAQAMLSSGHQMPVKQRREFLRDYLAMKGVEETLIPHVETHQEAIRTGDGPVSAVQILMGHQNFHARDLREKAGGTAAMLRLERMDPQQLARMIKQGSSELSIMGRQVMIACCQMDGVPQNEHRAAAEPKSPQMGGPSL